MLTPPDQRIFQTPLNVKAICPTEDSYFYPGVPQALPPQTDASGNLLPTNINLEVSRLQRVDTNRGSSRRALATGPWGFGMST